MYYVQEKRKSLLWKVGVLAEPNGGYCSRCGNRMPELFVVDDQDRFDPTRIAAIRMLCVKCVKH